MKQRHGHTQVGMVSDAASPRPRAGAWSRPNGGGGQHLCRTGGTLVIFEAAPDLAPHAYDHVQGACASASPRSMPLLKLTQPESAPRDPPAPLQTLALLSSARTIVQQGPLCRAVTQPRVVHQPHVGGPAGMGTQPVHMVSNIIQNGHHTE